MQQYIGIISKNEDGRPSVCSPDDYIRVRIPAFHGPKKTMALTGSKESVNDSICEDYELPWALVSRSFDNKTFSATEFQEDDLVYVVVENDDITTPIITGYASKYNYTDNIDVANSNLLFGGNAGAVTYAAYDKASSLVDMAKSQLGMTETPVNNIIYNSDYEGTVVNGSQYDWNVVFVWWCFKQIGASNDFCGGKKLRKLASVVDFYRKAGRFISKCQLSYYAGDLVHINIKDSSGNTADMLAIVAENQTSDSISVIIGDFSGVVEYKTIALDYIVGGIKLGEQVITNTVSGNPNEGKVFSMIRRLMGYNNAAAVAVITNIYHENNNFDPNLTHTDSDGYTHYGLCMWGPERWKKLEEYCAKEGYDKNTLDGQVYFIAEELGTSYKDVNEYLKELANTKTGAGDGAYYYAAHFEKCTEIYNGVNQWEKRRTSAENDFWPKYSGEVFSVGSQSQYGLILPLQYDNVVASAWWHSYGKDESSYHKGVDFITSGATGNTYGKDIVAVKDGTVVFAGSSSGSAASYGNYIIIDHGNITVDGATKSLRTLYAHCSGIVSGLTNVKQGQLIGYVGNSGNVSPAPTTANPHAGAHVHFEVRLNNTRVNPDPYLPSFEDKDGGKHGSSTNASSSSSTSSNSYHIHVNRESCRVTIYNSNNVIVKTMKCSVGLNNKTELGKFTIGAQDGKPARSRWRQLNGNVYGQYISRFNGSILFHSVPYYSQNAGDLESAEYDKLGTAASAGCVRLCVLDAKWIYENCPDGTPVEVADSGGASQPSNNQVDTKNQAFKSADSAKRKWDPTDPDQSNPWNN